MFIDRLDAARQLAARLTAYRNVEATIVLGIPRGGLQVAAGIAAALQLPLGIAAVKKVGAPANPEFAVGAVDDETGQLVDEQLAVELGLAGDQLAGVAANARERLRTWMSLMPRVPKMEMGNTAILVDDGVATGYTARVAVDALRRQGAARVVLAVPVAPADTARWLRSTVDEWVCLQTPDPFYAVGNFFRDWPQLTDDQVRALLLAGNRM